MARPRPVFPGKFYLVTRRCAGRRFFLRPSKRTNQALLYCLAEAAAETGVYILWFFAMSNHLHYGLYDPNGCYPKFLRRFHRNAARVLNCNLRRWGNLWEYEQTSMVELADAEAVFEKMIYSLTNAVKDHLVKYALSWPGASSLQAQLDDEELTIQRPDWFFDADSKMPEVATIRFRRPPPFRHLSQARWRAMIEKAIAVVERKALAERRTSGRRVLGVGAVRAQSAFESPKTHEPRRAISPRVAARDKWRRIEVIQRNKEWLAAYAAALESYRAGNTRAVFPAGTWQLYEDCHVYRAAA